MGAGTLRRHHEARRAARVDEQQEDRAAGGTDIARTYTETEVQALRAEVDKAKEDAATAIAKVEADAKALVDQANADADHRVNVTRERLQAEHAEAVRVAVETELAKLAAPTEEPSAPPPVVEAKPDDVRPVEAEPAKAPPEKPAGKPAKGASK